MKEPQGEQVELDFYFRHADRADAFSQVVRYCCRHGGRFAGTILQTEGVTARSHRFTHIYDRPLRELAVDARELERKLEDNDIDIIKVAIWSAIGITRNAPEVVTYSAVSRGAAQVDNPAIAVVGEGWVFSTPGYERQARKAGKRCYKRFLEICNVLDPDYAAILNEDSLPCIHDLASGAGKRCFANFFVSERAYARGTIAAIEALYEEAYTERTTTGIYVSTWSAYNPRRTTMESRLRLERSATVAEALGRRGNHRRHP